tara:strand:- start:504 stop:974 length:471 start_codon:yes stop_codon:yes gene_type:complete
MAKFLILLLVGIPIIEVATFIEIGGYLGLWPTVGAVIVTAIIGTIFLRKQGLETFFSAHDSLRQNRIPVNEIFDGVVLLLAGVLLLTPGFITDFIGLIFFIPWFRGFLRKYLLYQASRYGSSNGGQFDAKDGKQFSGSTIIDAEYEDLSVYNETRK